MAPRRRVTPEQEDAIRGAAARGETFAAIGEVYGLDKGTISRIVNPPPQRAPAVVLGSVPPRMAPPPSPKITSGPSSSSAAPDEGDDRSEEVDEPIHVSDDPRELAREDWLYYERRKLLLRRRAEREFKRGNIKGADLLEKRAQAAEERAVKLRPPAPPDPDTDPTYRAETRNLVEYLTALIEKAERGEDLPVRTIEMTQPVAELGR